MQIKKESHQLGILHDKNPNLKERENRDALLVVAFGTTKKKARESAIRAIFTGIQAGHSERRTVLAFTSSIVIERIWEAERIAVPTPEEALEQLLREGYTRVVITILQIIPGLEYEYLREVFREYADRFKELVLGTPLLYGQGQNGYRDDVAEVLQVLKRSFPPREASSAVLLMAHGTLHPANAFYSLLQLKCIQMKLYHVFIYTLEGMPSLEEWIPYLKKKKIRKICLMPFMLVAGNHVM